MAGEFCRARHEDGRHCVMADGHYGPHHFGRERQAPAETLIYERQPGETCSCARLNAREGAALTYYCSRCQPPTPTIAEAQRAAWRTEPTAEEAVRRAEAARRAAMQVQASERPSAMLGEALEHIRKARRIVAEMEGRALTPQVAADLGVATLKGREMAEHVERSLRAIGDEKANP